MSEFTIDMLAAALNVSRRTIERRIKDGSIVPTVATSNRGLRRNVRYWFSASQVAALKARTEEARCLGLKYVMPAITADGPVRRGTKRKPPVEPLSAHEFIRRLQWKRQHLFPRQRRAKAD